MYVWGVYDLGMEKLGLDHSMHQSGMHHQLGLHQSMHQSGMHHQSGMDQSMHQSD
jgi:hypothetical protein